MSDTSGESPPAPSTEPNSESPPSPADNASPPPQSDQGSPSSGGEPTSPQSPPPPEDSPSLLPPILPSDPSPPPPEESKSPPPVASPPPLSPPPKSPPAAASPPPEKSTPVSSPPPSHKSPPPPEESNSKSPPPKNEDSPSPPSPDASNQQPPPPTEFKPPPSDSPVSPSGSPTTPIPTTPNSAPPTYFAPPTSTDPNSSPPIGTPTKAIPSTSTPGSDSRSDTSSSSSSSNSPTEVQSAVHPGAVAGAAVAGVFLLALLGLFFVCSSRRRRRKRAEIYTSGQYIPAGTISIKSEGGYYPGQHHMNYSGPGPNDVYYAPPTPNSNVIHSYGSQRGGANGGGHDSSGLNMGGPNPYFSYEEMMEITNGFSAQNVLGEGGFGCVYKGLMSDGREVAVKQLKAGSGQGEREFKAEVEIISRVHHRHLVSLVGYCISEHHRLLVYEFVSNNTLEHHLHGPGMPVLDWTKRLKIALGAAKGLAYLHEDCHPKIIHRDIKSANILLEDSFEAQVADFGLAKPSNDTHTHVSTRVMGTFGYMAPEYASSGKLTDRSDVYSFGVVLLELITGRKPIDPTRPMGDESLVEWARPLLIDALETGDLSDLVDRRLEKRYVEGETMRMVEAAAACVRHSAPKRPRMVQVARALDCEGEMSDLSNGVKYGQSTIYDSGQYNQDIMKFRKMALEDSSEYDMYSGEFGNSRESKLRSGSSGESETRAFHAPRYGGRPF